MENLNLNYKIFGFSELIKEEMEIIKFGSKLYEDEFYLKWPENCDEILGILLQLIFLQMGFFENENWQNFNQQKISAITRFEFEIKN